MRKQQTWFQQLMSASFKLAPILTRTALHLSADQPSESQQRSLHVGRVGFAGTSRLSSRTGPFGMRSGTGRQCASSASAPKRPVIVVNRSENDRRGEGTLRPGAVNRQTEPQRRRWAISSRDSAYNRDSSCRHSPSYGHSDGSNNRSRGGNESGDTGGDDSRDTAYA